ncbi:hypothetical protein Bbelb_178790 [Branchiostoma belcheri]|nr:hypothetical protein Bbelb_178790 [Branchiostoma belcheri]
MDTVPRWLLGVCSLLAVFCPIVTSDSWIPSSSSWVVDSAGTPSGVVSDAGKALDGNSGTFWNPEELAQNYNNWYITLDLGASYSLSKIKFQNYGDTTHDVSAFALQKSSSSTPYVWGNVVSNSGVATGHNSFQEYAFTATSARYWKFIVTRTPNGYQPYLKELQFYGSGVAVAGGWSAWDAWTDCSVTCGNVTGSRTRTRRCDNPEPLFGGSSCAGDTQETSACSSDVSCPVIETGGSVGADHLLYPTLCMYGDGSTYRGSVNTTQSGLTCQHWDSQSPHAHNTTVTYPLAGLHENYCRNPDGAARPWCYTTDPDVAREYCDISNCFIDECYEGDGASYRGTANVTKSGRACQYWSNQTTHTHANTPENHPSSGLEENYCRNPNGTGYPWCYTQDPDVRDEECVIPRCDNQWTRYGTNYFRAYGEERKTYADAKATCAEENALLPIVKDSGTWDFLTNLRDSSGITTTVWIGVTDQEEEGTFVWDDGSPPGWEPDPSSHKSHWDCAKMTRNEDDPPNQLLSANCTNTKYYICERITRPCSPNPCINNGTCVETVPSGFLCRCGQNYTGTYCELPAVCVSYVELNESWRSVDFWQNKYDSSSVFRCDNRDTSISGAGGWYRFTGPAGTQMPTEQPTSTHRCGTHAPVWLNGAHPALQDGNVTRRVCAFWLSYSCYWSWNIQVRTCPGGYYVYQLPEPPACYLTYCGGVKKRAVYIRAHRPTLNRDGRRHKLSCTCDPLIRSRVSHVTFQA